MSRDAGRDQCPDAAPERGPPADERRACPLRAVRSRQARHRRPARRAPQSAGDLAAATGTHAPSLYRLLRLLASPGIFAEQDDGGFALTPLVEPLRADAPDSVRLPLLVTGEIAYGAISGLLHSVQTGEPAFERHHGMGWWEYFAAHPDDAAVHDGMFARLASALLTAHDFGGVGLLVDVSGGYGGLLQPILRVHPAMRGVIVDLPHVAPGGGRMLIRPALPGADDAALPGGEVAARQPGPLPPAHALAQRAGTRARARPSVDNGAA